MDSASPPPTDFDREVALMYCDGDAVLLQEMLQSFRESWPRFLADLEAALAARDARALEQRAHKLKGRAATLGAEAVRQSAYQLEVLGQGADLAPAPSVLAALRQALHRLEAQLSEVFP